MDANKLAIIWPQMLKNLPCLERLDFQYNNIERVDADFLDLPFLVYLYLSHNYITSIDSRAFRGLGNLQYLFLGDNPLSLIGPGAFQTMHSLMFLYMYKTNLKVLKSEILPNSSWTAAILLFDSAIQRIEDGTFDALTNVEHIYLHQNNFSHLPEGIFESLNTKSLEL
jgi:Leucine-rich repeat (LRR) protein